ncbi:MAG: type II and III secretion system protein family protein [Rhodobacteraceae bacterium]|nr:type II and III secretion system protein family protein [Paracoccaceae bacterium]
MTLCALLVFDTGAAQAQNHSQDGALVVSIGRAQVLQLPRDAADVVVSDPSIVDTVLRTASQPVLFGLKIGQANVLFFDQSGAKMREIQVRVEYDTGMLDRLITEQFPEARVTTESVLGEVILSGEVAVSAEAAAIGALTQRFVAASRKAQDRDGGGEAKEASTDGGGVVNRIVVLNEEQVLLKVRIAEVNRSVLKRLGVDWNAGLQASTLTTSLGFTGRTLAGFLQNYSIAQLTDLDGAIIDANGDGVQDIIFQQNRPIQVGPQSLDSFLKALEQHQMLRTLAEPSLTAVSGERASFLAGGEFPVPVSRDENSISVEFKRFGVGLEFTPVVVGDGRISLQVSTEVSDLTDRGSVNSNGLVIPALSVRRANTTLEMTSGGTMMMAGLIQQNTRRLSSGLPGLRQVPLLGQLFRSEEFQSEETELVILVSPYAVRQGEMSDFRLPTDGFAPASDLDMYLFGQLHRVYGDRDPDSDPTAAETTAEALRAPVGFIME